MDRQRSDCRRTLGGEDEREEDEGHLLVGKLADLALDDLRHPLVEQAVRFLALAHRDLRVGGGLHQVFDGDLARTARVPDLGARERKREVDQLQRLRDLPIFGRHLLRRIFRDVRAAENAKGRHHVEVAELELVRLRVRVRVGEPLLKVLAVDLVLDAQVDSVRTNWSDGSRAKRRQRDELECLGREKNVKRFAVLVVDLAVQENPVFGCAIHENRQHTYRQDDPKETTRTQEDVLGRLDETRLGVGRRVEDLASVVGRRGDDNVAVSGTAGVSECVRCRDHVTRGNGHVEDPVRNDAGVSSDSAKKIQ